jgi:hypothetical protein
MRGKRPGFSYTAYGLGIHSVLPLPELEGKEAAADVVVHLGQVDRSRLEVVDEYHAFWADSKEACHFFKDAGAFLVRGGREIIVDPVPEADERAIRLSLLGPAFALILLQRGRLVLHGSSIAVSGSTVAFVGGHGWGKSTMAAALHNRGHHMVTDDVMAIDIGSGCPMVIPSFPQFKLWPQAVTTLENVPETLPLVLSSSEKRALRVARRFAQTSLPLKRLYVLAKRPTLEIEPLSPRQALVELMRHSYGARFGKQFLQITGTTRYFTQCASLANSVQVCRLKRPPCLSELNELARFVEADLIQTL